MKKCDSMKAGVKNIVYTLFMIMQDFFFRSLIIFFKCATKPLLPKPIYENGNFERKALLRYDFKESLIFLLYFKSHLLFACKDK